MKLTLIRPNMGSKDGKKYRDIASMEPYVLAVIAGLTPPGIEIQMFDDRVEEIDYDAPTDLVGITVEVFTAKRAYRIAKQYRARGVPVVMGGFHASLLPEEVSGHADAVVVGEAEPVWKTVLDDFRSGKLKKIYKSGFKCDLQGYQPDRSIFKNKKYVPITLTHFSRGCPYRCTFCPDASLYKGNIRFRNAADVVEDIARQPRNFIFFVDNNISANRKKFKELLRAITPLKVKWVSQADINVAEDDELLKLMNESGCGGLVLGFETLDINNLNLMSKPQNIKSFSKYDELIAKIHDHGICIWGAFLLGYDSDTLDTFRSTLDFALEHKLFLAAFNALIPFYGTPIYTQLKKEKRLLYKKWWLDPNYRFGLPLYQPKHMAPEQLTEGCVAAIMKFTGAVNVLKRSTNFKANLRSFYNLQAFFGYNYLYRREFKQKYLVTLGYEESGE